MADGPASRAAARAWLALAALLAAGALLAALLNVRDALEWQPPRFAAQPWRAWTAAFVHYSDLHLGANLAGVALVGGLGVAAPVSGRAVLAWLAAWPLTHLALLVQPALAHYGGLSGVLHAGVAVVGVHVARAGFGRRRALGLAILAVLAAKVAGEAPWGPVLRHPAGWDIAVAPLAHATGAMAGVACALIAGAWSGRAAPRRP